MLKIYGHPQTRAFRALWLAEELGIPYEHDPVAGSRTRSPEFLQINPNGHVPAIQDGDVTLFESLAINLYLAAKYGREKGLWPATVEDQGRTYQWSFWAVTEAEVPVVELLFQRVLLPAAERSAEKAKAAEEKLATPLRILDAALEGRDHVLGSTFTVADVNLGGVLALLPRVGVDVSGCPRVAAWLERVTARPAVARARKG